MASNYPTALFQRIFKREYSIEGISDTESYYPGCHCKTCLDSQCSCLNKSKYVYDEGFLKIDHILSKFNYPIFECNSNCVCDLNCANRVTQRDYLYCFQVFNTDYKGLGLRCHTQFSTGQFVIEFIGEIIKVREAKKRLEKLNTIDPCYIIILKEHAGDTKTFITCIDATLKGNESRFINHSCKPNLTIMPVRVNSILPHLCMFALKDIPIGEELTYDYAGGSDVIVDKATSVCLCKSDNCRGYLPYQDV
ncbi:Histone-lysine N-methyltransferase SETMAR [Oopsacas minuta]|uniref:Histone-lysine N-methyltransferase SETMAR n=1 Tax=Oopsacas minuta TaxID=111878 RepID=A0AAV7JUR6_9METZ|nr:Histone-lysine N-methyltransferase SETMAR [Oopsacas minuta]